jgi:hypothetical protein
MYAKLVTGTGTITGSIAKFQATGDADAEVVIDRCEWGTHFSDETTTTTSAISTDFTIPAGSYVEGPICQLKLTSGTILAYIND